MRKHQAWSRYGLRLAVVLIVTLTPLGLLQLKASRAAQPSIQQQTQIYLALGDSLTTGYEAPQNNDGELGYPQFIYDALKQSKPDLQYHLLGRNGETSSSMISGSQLNNAVSFIEEQTQNGALVSPITLDIGGNDMVAVLLQQASSESARTLFRANLANILDQLIAAMSAGGSHQGELVIMSYYNPYPGVKPPLYPIDTDAELKLFNAIILEEASKRGVKVAPVFEAFEGHESEFVFADFSRYPDQSALDYHPRKAGHLAIAETFLKLLQDEPTTETPTSETPTITETPTNETPNDQFVFLPSVLSSAE